MPPDITIRPPRYLRGTESHSKRQKLKGQSKETPTETTEGDGQPDKHRSDRHETRNRSQPIDPERSLSLPSSCHSAPLPWQVAQVPLPRKGALCTQAELHHQGKCRWSESGRDSGHGCPSGVRVHGPRGPERDAHTLTLGKMCQPYTWSASSQKGLKTRHGLLFRPSASHSLCVVGLGGLKGQKLSHPPTALRHTHLGIASQGTSPGQKRWHCHHGLPCVG